MGCAKCKMVEENVRKALGPNRKAEVVKVTSLDQILEYGVVSTPALVVDGKVRASGRVPTVEEIAKWLKK